MKCAVTVSLVPEVRGGPFVFWNDLATAAQQAASLGFTGIEIFPSSADAIDSDQVQRQLHQNHLELAAMGTGAGWVKHKLSLTSGVEQVRLEAEAFIRAIIDKAGRLGAPAIIGSMQGRWGDGIEKAQALDWLAAALDRLAHHAKQYRVPVLYEMINRYESNLINTIGEVASFLRRLNTDNVRILADLFHMNIEEETIAAGLHAGRGTIGHIHFVDSNRRPAGFGHIDFTAVAQALRAIDYQGYLSAEALPYPDSVTAAQQTMAAFNRFFHDGS